MQPSMPHLRGTLSATSSVSRANHPPENAFRPWVRDDSGVYEGCSPSVRSDDLEARGLGSSRECHQAYGALEEYDCRHQNDDSFLALLNDVEFNRLSTRA